jgi:hypothetical protein
MGFSPSSLVLSSSAQMPHIITCIKVFLEGYKTQRVDGSSRKTESARKWTREKKYISRGRWRKKENKWCYIIGNSSIVNSSMQHLRKRMKKIHNMRETFSLGVGFALHGLPNPFPSASDNMLTVLPLLSESENVTLSVSITIATVVNTLACVEAKCPPTPESISFIVLKQFSTRSRLL